MSDGDRVPAIDVPRKATFTIGDGQRRAGWIVRLSVEELVLEAPEPPPLDAEVLIVSELWAGEGDLVLRGRAQWSTAMRFAVQLGPLGAEETNAILRFSRRSAA
ncbi:MAG TPA: hypothetical protein VF765_06490 [Polyangiaceae bacterium]